jgi:pyroglutamyl-peptidase
MSNARTTVLMTGFGPFPSVPENATMRLVPALAERARRAFPDLCIETDVLPTEWRAAPARVETLYALHAPDIAPHFSV